MRELEEQVRALRESAPAAPKPAPATPAPPPLPAPTGAQPLPQGPFAIATPDGKNRLKVGGLIQSTFRTYPETGGRTAGSGFYMRRVRPILDGTVAGFVDFRLMPDFLEGRAILQDGFIDLRLGRQFLVRSGKYKVPYSLETLQAAAAVPFVERSIGNNLAVLRDVGVMLLSGPDRSGVEWELGVFNGAVDNGAPDGDADDKKEVAARVFFQPYLSRPNSRLRGLGFGVAATAGRTTEPLTGQVYRTASRTPFFRYADGVAGAGDRLRLAPQFYFYSGPFGLLGQHYTTRQRIAKGAVADTVGFSGFNIQATYVLTGEPTSFRNVVPKRPFESGSSGRGAFELAARYSQLRVGADVFRGGFADPATAADKADAYTLGLNWYLNTTVKAQFNYEHTAFGRPIQFGAAGRRSREDALLSQLQILF